MEKTEGGSDKVEIFSACNLDQLPKKVQNNVFVSGALHGEIWILDIQLWILLFLQGEFQEKLNKVKVKMKGEEDIFANFLLTLI